MYTIYGLARTDQVIRYVGVTRTPAKRLKEHLSATCNAYLPVSKWAFKYRDEIQMIVLEVCETVEDAWAAEIKWMTEYQSNELYNINPGGRYNGHRKPTSDETREKQRLAHLGKKLTPEHIEKVRLAHTGRVHTPEARAAMKLGASKRNAHEGGMKGKKHSPETLEKMRAVQQARSEAGENPGSNGKLRGKSRPDMAERWEKYRADKRREQENDGAVQLSEE